MKSKAFTLAELLVLIGIILILFAMLLPPIMRTQERIKARQEIQREKQAEMQQFQRTNTTVYSQPYLGR